MIKNANLNGFSLYYLPTDKFKTITISLKLATELTKENAALRTLLSYMLITGTKQHPGAKELSAYLEDMYGMSLVTNVSTKGKMHILNISTSCVNGSYLNKGKDLLIKQIGLINDIFNTPNFKNNLFDELMFKVKKQELIDNLKSMQDNKASYALDTMLSYMGANDYLAIRAYSTISDIEKISLEDISNYLKICLDNDQKYLYIVGDIDDSIVDLVQNNLSLPKSLNKYTGPIQFISDKVEPIEIIENQDIKQSKLSIGYVVNSLITDSNYYAFTLFNSIFGGDSQSKLFKIVREKHSLCYTIYSSFDPNNGIMIINAGIDNKAYKQTIELISNILNDCQNNLITETDLNLAKSMIISSLIKSQDTAMGIINFISGMVFNQNTITIEKYISNIKKVTLEDVIEVSKHIKLDTIYFLTGGSIDGE